MRLLKPCKFHETTNSYYTKSCSCEECEHKREMEKDFEKTHQKMIDRLIKKTLKELDKPSSYEDTRYT